MKTAFDDYDLRQASTVTVPPASASVHAPVHRLHFPRGSAVYEFGDPAQALYRVDDGLVRMARVAPDGRVHTIRHVLPGDFFGEESFANPMHTEHAEALTDVSVKAYDPRYLDMHDLWVITQSLSAQVQRMMDFGYHLQTGELMQRVARYLVSLSQTPLCTWDANDCPKIAATHELIAEGTGSTRESVSKIVTELREAGHIGTGYRSILVHDLSALAEIADA